MIDKAKHIVFLTPGFPIKEADTQVIPALTVYLKVLQQQEGDYLKLTVITFQYPFTSKPYEWNGIDVIPLNGKESVIKKVSIWFKANRILRQLHQKKTITCIHSFWLGECALIGQRFAIKHQLLHVITIMGQESIINNRYYKLLDVNYSKFISLCKRHSDSVKNSLGILTEIIPWAIDINDFDKINDQKIDILGVGSLNTVKNYNLFIDIIAAVTQTHPNIKVEVLGGGKLLKEIQLKIKSLNLDSNIKLLGELSREEVLVKMSTSNILLHTSNFESFGFVFPEALYSGMKIVSGSVGCAQDLNQWKICNTKNDYVYHCVEFLNSSYGKEQVLLNSLPDTINSYLKLYLS